MSAITELYDPTVHLGGTPVGTMGDTMEKLKGDCGWIINAIDWVVEKFWSPGLREAIITKLAGDFNAMSSMQEAWANVEVALEETHLNYNALAVQVPAVWEGLGGRNASARMTDIGAMHADQSEAAGLIKDQVGNLIEVSVASAEVVVECLHMINDICQDLISALAVPGVGWAKVALTAKARIKRAISLINRALEAIETITRAVTTALRFLTVANAGLGVGNALLNLGEAATGARAGGKVDETADRGFG